MTATRPHPEPPSAPSGPLHIDTLPLPGGGVLAMCHCPGRCTPDANGRAWQRDLRSDVLAIRSAGITTVLSLLSDEELSALGAGSLGEQLQAAGVCWLQYPIRDFGVPDGAGRANWQRVQSAILEQLQQGQGVLVHCAAGLGRTGTMVAVLLKALGYPGSQAVQMVRAARPGTIETAAQLALVTGSDA